MRKVSFEKATLFKCFPSVFKNRIETLPLRCYKKYSEISYDSNFNNHYSNNSIIKLLFSTQDYDVISFQIIYDLIKSINQKYIIKQIYSK